MAAVEPPPSFLTHAMCDWGEVLPGDVVWAQDWGCWIRIQSVMKPHAGPEGWLRGSIARKVSVVSNVETGSDVKYVLPVDRQMVRRLL